MEDIEILNAIWERQRKFNQKLVDYDRLTDADRHSLTRDYCLSINEEVAELSRCIDWKTHRRHSNKGPSGSNILEEGIDVFKYIVSVCLVWGITPREFLEAFNRKSDVVEDVWRQEFERPFDPAKYKRIVAVDIDGVLADYYNGYLSWVEGKIFKPLQRGAHDVFAIVSEAVGPERAAQIKHEYRESGGKLSLPVIQGAHEMLHWLRNEGLFIVLLSSRPFKQYRRIMADTVAWLKNNDLPYDTIVWDPAKSYRLSSEYPDLLFAIEDEPHNAYAILAKGFPVFMPYQPYNAHATDARNLYRYSPAMWNSVIPPVTRSLLSPPSVEVPNG